MLYAVYSSSEVALLSRFFFFYSKREKPVNSLCCNLSRFLPLFRSFLLFLLSMLALLSSLLSHFPSQIITQPQYFLSLFCKWFTCPFIDCPTANTGSKTTTTRFWRRPAADFAGILATCSTSCNAILLRRTTVDAAIWCVGVIQWALKEPSSCGSSYAEVLVSLQLAIWVLFGTN